MNKNLQRAAYEAFVRSGASPVPPSEVDKPLADGSYRTSAANAGWVFWQAAQAALQQAQVSHGGVGQQLSPPTRKGKNLGFLVNECERPAGAIFVAHGD